MNNVIILESKSIPDQWGYKDKIAVFNDKDLLFHSEASCCPNPCKPWPNSMIKWQEAYGWINNGTYSWKCIRHWRRGKCILINEGKACTARRPNVNHDGQSIVTEIFIHKGWSKKWRGSAGCITIPPKEWVGFTNNFEVGDSGRLEIVDYRAIEGGQTCKKSKYCPLYEGV